MMGGYVKSRTVLTVTQDEHDRYATQPGLRYCPRRLEEVDVFAVIGEALIDMVQPEPGLMFEAQPGGGPLNIAIGLRRLGHETAFLGRLSTRALGDLVRAHVEGNGLALDTSVSTDSQTTLAFAALDEQGKASYDFYVQDTADWGWTDDELSVLPTGCRAVHTGSLAGFLRPGADAILRLWERRRSEGRLLLSFDPNVRPDLVGPRRDAVARVERLVAASHVVKASDDDVAWLYPERSAEDVLRRWATLGPELVVVTMGSSGCVGLRPSGSPLRASGVTVDVADTIGAGDAFASGLLSGLADSGGLAPGGVAGLDDVEVRSVLERAVLVSALTCRRSGADPPTREEYDQEMRRRDTETVGS
jgi:fructokinase